MTEESRGPSIRGLIDSDIGPLRRFTGVLDSFPEEPRIYNEGKPNARTSYIVSLNFKDLEVIEAIEPYQFPIFTIPLTKSNRKKSRYGAFGMSLIEVLDIQYTEAQKDPNSPEYVKPADRTDLKDCLGKRMGMVMADGEDSRPPKHMLFDGRAVDEKNPKGQDVETPVWVVYMVEGIGVLGDAGVTPTARAIELLDGKTLSEFNQVAMADELIRNDTDLLTSIGMPVSSPKSFANTMIATGQFMKNTKTGIYTKAAPEVESELPEFSSPPPPPAQKPTARRK